MSARRAARQRLIRALRQIRPSVSLPEDANNGAVLVAAAQAVSDLLTRVSSLVSQGIAPQLSRSAMSLQSAADELQASSAAPSGGSGVVDQARSLPLAAAFRASELLNALGSISVDLSRSLSAFASYLALGPVDSPGESFEHILTSAIDPNGLGAIAIPVVDNAANMLSLGRQTQLRGMGEPAAAFLFLVWQSICYPLVLIPSFPRFFFFRLTQPRDRQRPRARPPPPIPVQLEVIAQPSLPRLHRAPVCIPASVPYHRACCLRSVSGTSRAWMVRSGSMRSWSALTGPTT